MTPVVLKYEPTIRSPGVTAAGNRAFEYLGQGTASGHDSLLLQWPPVFMKGTEQGRHPCLRPAEKYVPKV